MPINLTGKFTPSGGPQSFKLYDAADIDTAVVSKVAGYTATGADNIVLCSGTFALVLYTAVGKTGNRLDIKNTEGGIITVQPYGSETIDGTAPILMQGQNCAMTIISDGANWWIV